jgi:hypothetical protein
MPLAPATVAGRIAAMALPDLDDPAKFVRIPDVPILDVHDHESKGDVDEQLLHTLAENTNARCQRGDLVALTLGHTLPDGPERDQPEFVGYGRNLSVGLFRGEPCLLIDFYLRAEDKDLALKFPHRSIERVRSPERAGNYIDYVCLLRRPPERSLGLLTYARTLPAGSDVVRYERDLAAKPGTPPAVREPEPETPEEPAMTPDQIAALVASITDAVTQAMAPVLAALKPEADADSPADGDRVQMEEAAPSGSNTFIPKIIKDGKEEEARKQYQQLQDERDQLEIDNRRLRYSKRFEELEREGILFNREAEMAKLLRMPADMRDGHFQDMRTNYQRRAGGPPADSASSPESEADERQAVIDFALKNRIDDIPEARSRYRQERAGRVTAGTSQGERAAVLAYAAKHSISDLTEARTRYRRERDGLDRR